MRTCEDCGTATDQWTRGWDGRVRCMVHAPNGRLGALAHHCATCTCTTQPAPSTQNGGA